MKNTKLLTAALAAMIALAGCGYVEDTPEEDTQAGAVQSESADESSETSVEEKIDPQYDPSESDSQTDESAASEADSSEEQTESSDNGSDETTAGKVIENGGYNNSEFGFYLPLPDGTEYNEIDDMLKDAFDDDEVQFRALMETVSTDRFNMAVQLFDTAKTLDDFAKGRWEYADRVNSAGEEEVTILDTSNAEIGGKPAEVVTEKLVGANGTFCTLRAYIQISDRQYIYIQGNCYDEETLAELRACAEEMTFS